MEEKVKQKRLHKMHMENRNKLEMTGIVDVISFDLNKILPGKSLLYNQKAKSDSAASPV